MPNIYIGSDHGGYEVKEKIKKWFTKENINYIDVGTDSEDVTDYPIFAKKVGKAVAKGLGVGILICKSGQGMSMVVNKTRGVRGCVAWSQEIAEKSREHNDANVLCLPGGYLTFGKIKKIISIWVSTPFSEEERHKRRVSMI